MTRYELDPDELREWFPDLYDYFEGRDLNKVETRLRHFYDKVGSESPPPIILGYLRGFQGFKRARGRLSTIAGKIPKREGEPGERELRKLCGGMIFWTIRTSRVEGDEASRFAAALYTASFARNIDYPVDGLREKTRKKFRHALESSGRRMVPDVKLGRPHEELSARELTKNQRELTEAVARSKERGDLFWKCLHEGWIDQRDGHDLGEALHAAVSIAAETSHWPPLSERHFIVKRISEGLTSDLTIPEFLERAQHPALIDVDSDLYPLHFLSGQERGLKSAAEKVDLRLDGHYGAPRLITQFAQERMLIESLEETDIG